MTGEEIRTILSASEQEGALEPQLTKMLRGVFDLDDHTARDAMVPRTEVDAVEHTASIADVFSLFKEDLRERYPIYETTVDNIIGVVSMKQLLMRMASADKPDMSKSIADLPIREVMMPAYYIPDTMPLSTLLNEFTNNRKQIAIVLDEYGGTEGLITLEDILEEIVGDYEDEFTPRHRHIKKEDQHHFVINGGVRVTELEPKLNYPFPTGDYVTLGGLILQRLGRMAKVGDTVELEGARLEVLEMDNHRIVKVLFRDETSGQEEEDPDEQAVKLLTAENDTDGASPKAAARTPKGPSVSGSKNSDPNSNKDGDPA